MGAANCAAVLLSVPISHHFHGCTALLVTLVVVSGAILNTHLYLYPFSRHTWVSRCTHKALWDILEQSLQQQQPPCNAKYCHQLHHLPEISTNWSGNTFLLICWTILMFKSLNGQALQYLSEECQVPGGAGRQSTTRSSNTLTCVMPLTRTRLGDRPFAVTGQHYLEHAAGNVWWMTVSRTKATASVKQMCLQQMLKSHTDCVRFERLLFNWDCGTKWLLFVFSYSHVSLII